MKTRVLVTWFAAGMMSLLLSVTTAKSQNPAPRDHEGPAKPQREMEERMVAQRQLEELHGDLKDLEAAGKMEKAGEVARKIVHLQEKLGPKPPGTEGRRPGPPEPGRGMSPQKGGPPPGPEPAAELRGRLLHVRIAIEQLRLAGLDEAAQRLEEQTQKWRARRRGLGGPGLPPPWAGAGAPGFGGRALGPPPSVQAELNELRDHVNELQREIQQLRDRLEKQGGDRR